MTSSPRLTDRIALITGASRGIGRAVALAFAREGAHVVLLARTRGALEEVDDEIRAAGGAATLVPMNLKHAQKVDALGPSLFERWGKLDILVANAGVLGPLSPLHHVTDADWQNVLDINLSANWRLIRTLDPLLRRSDAGRAIFVTSGAARNHKAYWGPYAVSKAALEAMAKIYAAEHATTNVGVNLVNPGPIATAMRAKAFPGEDPGTLPKPEDLADLFVTLASPECEETGRHYDFQ
ncbi:MAG: SDR family NAD(P)-dependent oxidoreductase [Hyphomicrobiaceae bacterium]